MKIRITSALLSAFIIASMLLLGAMTAHAQIDSTAVVTSSDSTIIEAEKMDEAAAKEPVQPSVDDVIAKRLKALQKDRIK